MEQDVSELEVPVHDLVLDEGLEGIEDLAEVLDDLFLREQSFLPDLGEHISSIAVLEHEVVVVGGLLEGVELDYVRVVAGLQHFDLVLKQFVKLP